MLSSLWLLLVLLAFFLVAIRVVEEKKIVEKLDRGFIITAYGAKLIVIYKYKA